ncbi:MAG: hypothetical protein AAGA62_04110, partial [Bacteroidota bacterium]
MGSEYKGRRGRFIFYGHIIRHRYLYRIKRILDILSWADRRQFYRLSCGVALLALFEVVGVASVLPFMALLADPGQIEQSNLLQTAYAWGGF